MPSSELGLLRNTNGLKEWKRCHAETCYSPYSQLEIFEGGPKTRLHKSVDLETLQFPAG